jgi:hypothetical protein
MPGSSVEITARFWEGAQLYLALYTALLTETPNLSRISSSSMAKEYRPHIGYLI